MLEKKFLDYDGVQHLWTKLSMEDYPNNETLVAVINAIDATKADKDKLSTVATSGSYTDLINKPQKGVDYWTPQDKQQIVNEVLAALNVAAIHTGPTAPTNDIGQNGDIYLMK